MRYLLSVCVLGVVCGAGARIRVPCSNEHDRVKWKAWLLIIPVAEIIRAFGAIYYTYWSNGGKEKCEEEMS